MKSRWEHQEKEIDAALINHGVVISDVLFGVALYLQDRAYGGPEEGGWWYNTGTIVMDGSLYAEIELLPTFHFDVGAARQARDTMNERAAVLNEGRHEPSSVLSDGHYRAEVHQYPMPTHYPETRPRYE